MTSQSSACERCRATECDLRDIENSDNNGGGGGDRKPLQSEDFRFAPLFQDASAEARSDDGVTRFRVDEWRKIASAEEAVTSVNLMGRNVVVVKSGVLAKVAHQCIADIQHHFRKDQLAGWAGILKDPEASDNDRFVAMQLLKNACIASGGILPACQDTGTAIVLGKKGECVWTEEPDDEEALSSGVFDAYASHNLRYSQVAPVSMFAEANTRTNLPVQMDLMATKGSEYKFLFIAKGGGSANKSVLFQQTKALLNPVALRKFIREKLKTIGTAACPPYHIAFVIGGLSAEQCMKTVKLASCRYYDDLPTTGDPNTARAFRDIEWERIVLEEAQATGIGAQFGGKYFAHQVRVVRLPRHGASCPVGMGVSCSADRQILAKINAEGVFVEQLVRDPASYLPEVLPESLRGDQQQVVSIDLSQPMADIRKVLSQHPIRTRLSLSGSIVVARDIAHAELKERLDRGEGLPDYVKNCCIYYAGPAKTPDGLASGSFGPTTAGRMDSYVAPFMAAGGSFVTLAKGNRSAEVTRACKEYGGFYLGSIGGPAAVLATESIRKVEVLEFAELGMEAVWRIEIRDFPAFIVVDDKGNDFFADLV